MPSTTLQKLLAEFVGTLVVVFVVAGAVVTIGTAGEVRGDLLTVALAYGLAVAAMVSALAHVSGGHFNPAVTLGALVTGRLPVAAAAGYVVAQLAGGTVGAFLVRATVPENVWRPARLGLPTVNEFAGISTGQAVLAEAVLTFVVVWVMFALGASGARASMGFAAGFAVVAGVIVGGPISGAALNPARAFGPALAGGQWAHHWVYWVGPVAGGVVAAVLHDLVVARAGSGDGPAALDDLPA